MSRLLIVIMAAAVVAAAGFSPGAQAAQDAMLPPGAAPASPLAAAVGTAFTYQGQLSDAGTPANGEYDIQFQLFDAASGGSSIGPTILVDNVAVADGRFTVSLDFGQNPFGDGARWLQIGVRPGSGGSLVALSPRQELTPAPYALALPNVTTDEASGFVGVGRANRISANEFFGVSGEFGTSYAGMYVESSNPDGDPFYGYATDGQAIAWTYISGEDNTWRLWNSGDRLEVPSGGGLVVNEPTTAGLADAVRINSAADDAIQVGTADSQPNYGFYTPYGGAEFTALLVSTQNANGNWALSTSDNINAANVNLATQTLLARVGGQGSLQPGDVVAATGLGEPLEAGEQRLAAVERAGRQDAGLAGVVATRLEYALAPGKEADGVRILQAADGPARPGDLVQLVVLGVAEVRVDRTAAIEAGQRLTASQAAPGAARMLRQALLDGMPVTEGAPVIGTALESARGRDTVPVLVNLR